MKWKILLALALILSIAFFYAAFRILYEHSPADEKKSLESPRNNSDQNSFLKADEENNASKDNLEMVPGKSPGDILGISEIDCEDRCSRFGNPDELKYCENVCGLTPPGAGGSCENMAGIEKDYCLKDLGIGKRDFKICDQISDEALKKTCRNRVTEDFMDESHDPLE